MKRITILIIFVGLLYGCGTSKKSTSTDQSSSITEEEIIQNIKEQIEKSIEPPSIEERPVYHGSPTMLTRLKHTKLEVDFNWAESQMNGVATITASPYFYASDSLLLEAKAMEIKSITLGGKALNYKYNDGHNLRVGLDRKYTRDESYEVVIEYIAKPEEFEEGGSAAIISDKGLYFINPRGEDSYKMPQIWTQGETESNSIWFPTIDKPNQKTTTELFITVEDKYKTLSNGNLVSSKKNKDGTRTDYWKQDLAHAPYLVMMAIGEFAIVEDSYTKSDGTVIPVYYYVEPEWEKYAKNIFGETPAMMKFFSELLGVEYPWDKYHQVIVREYVSGAMENTGAVVFGDFAYKTSRELIDSDDQSTIAHELFHHWFGNLVTLESWSNLPLNEAFANYSEYLWMEHHIGRDQADYVAHNERQQYYNSAKYSGHHDMIWYDYDDKEDMFDSHSYSKGGRVLHMLRYYLGDEAFFLGLKNYLNKNAFSTAELADLRMAFEEICGEDLNWFFNQWFLASGHPILDISQEINDNKVSLTIKQNQDLNEFPLYKIPTTVGVYANDQLKSYDIVIDKLENKFVFEFEGKLQNIIVDEEDALLAEMTHDKPLEWLEHQLFNAARYRYRIDAISGLGDNQKQEILLNALEDEFWVVRLGSAHAIGEPKQNIKNEFYQKLIGLAKSDESSQVRAGVQKLLVEYFGDESEVSTLLENAIQNDSSLLVVTYALNGLAELGGEHITRALDLAKNLESVEGTTLKTQLVELYSGYGDESHMEFMANTLKKGEISGYQIINSFMAFTSYFTQQDIDLQIDHFDVYEKLSKDGGYYHRILLPYALNMLNSYLITYKEQYTIRLEEAKGDEKQLFLDKINKIDSLSSKIEKMLK